MNTPVPLTDAALARLRALASSNGASGEIIQLLSTEERACELTATMTLTPHVSAQAGRQPGTVKGRKIHNFASTAEMQQHLTKQQKEFTATQSWFDAIKGELHKMPGQGWGAEGLRFELDERTEQLAASEACVECGGARASACPTCHGNKTMPCNQCQARGQEICPACQGTGMQPGGNGQQPCITCRGARSVGCRTCQGRGATACPTCRGSGGMQCTGCRGTGMITDLVKLNYSVEVSFAINHGADVPSAIRNLIGRNGPDLLARGHADISYVRDGETGGSVQRLHYTAAFPAAEMALSILNKRMRVTVFGNRRALLDVPPFLDATLKAARKALAMAAEGSDMLQDACKAKVIEDALRITLAGQREARDLLRQHPIALSRNCATEIMQNVTRALKQVTLKARWLASGGSVALACGAFAALFMTPALAGLPLSARVAAELVAAPVMMGFGWFAVGRAGRMALTRRFGPGAAAGKMATPPSGKIGMTTMALILVVYLLFALLGPAQPAWLAWVGAMLQN